MIRRKTGSFVFFSLSFPSFLFFCIFSLVSCLSFLFVLAFSDVFPIPSSFEQPYTALRWDDLLVLYFLLRFRPVRREKGGGIIWLEKFMTS